MQANKMGGKIEDTQIWDSVWCLRLHVHVIKNSKSRILMLLIHPSHQNAYGETPNFCRASVDARKIHRGRLEASTRKCVQHRHVCYMTASLLSAQITLSASCKAHNFRVTQLRYKHLQNSFQFLCFLEHFNRLKWRPNTVGRRLN